MELYREKRLKPTNVPGRRGASEHPNIFYRLPSSSYSHLIPVMKKKLDLSIFISGVSGAMGHYAELLWWRAFKRNGWILYPDTEEGPFAVNTYGGRRASTNNDIDFIAEKDGILYGVEIKNGLVYPDDLFWKFLVASELDTIPLFIARWLNPAHVPLIKELGGEPIVYRDAIYSITYGQFIEEARKLLGVHIMTLDEVDDNYFIRKVEIVYNAVKSQLTDKRDRLKRFIISGQYDSNIRRTLGDKNFSSGWQHHNELFTL